MKDTGSEKEIGKLRKMLEESLSRESALKQKVQRLHDNLERTGEQYRAIFENANDAILLMKDGVFVTCNSKSESIFGRSRSEIVGSSPLDFSPEVQAGGEKSAIAAAKFIKRAIDGERFRFDWIHTRKDGSHFITDISLSLIQLDDEAFVLSIVRDITDRRKAQRELETEREFFEHLFQGIPEGVVLLDKEDRIIDCNRAFEALFQYDKDEIAGMRINDVIVPDHLKNEGTDATNDVAAGKFIQFDTERKAKDGSLIQVSITGKPINIAGGETSVIGVYRNITDLKRTELKEQVLREITQATFDTDETDVLIGKIRNILHKIIDTTNFYIALYNPDTNLLTIPYEKDEKDNIESWPAEQSVTGLVVANKQPLLVQKPAIRALMDEGIIEQVGNMCEVWLGVPLLSGAEVIGAIVVQDYENPDAYNKESQAVLEFVAHHVSLAIQRQQNINELRFQSTVLDQIRDRVTVTNMEGFITYVNDAECKALNLSSEELIGQNLIEYGNDLKKQEKRREIIERTKKTGGWHGEVRNTDKEGKEIILDVRSSLVHDEKGNPIGISAISRDVTEQRKTARQRDYHFRFQQMIARISSEFVGITNATFDHRIDFMLQEMGEFFEVDRSYLFLFSEDHKVMTNTYEWCDEGIEPQINSMQNFAVSGLPWWSDQIFKRKAVHIPDVSLLPDAAQKEKQEFTRQGIQSLLTLPVHDAYGHISGFFGFDAVRGKKRWTNYQVDFLRILANIITDAIKTVKIEQSLVKAKEKAEESDRLKSAFLANVSHEIRTPMNAILGFLSLLREPMLNEGQRSEYIEIVNKSGQRLLDTINDIMELSKIEAGQVEVQREEVNLSELMMDQYNLFLPQVREKGLSFRKSEKIPSTLPKIVTDRHKLEGIMINLINNAIKFTNTGVVEFGNFLQDDEIVFYVKDTGIGIPHDKQEAVFERFVQADLGLARKHEGTGLGLSIVRAYLDLLHGRIWLESEPGNGTTFYFAIPHESRENPLSSSS